MLKHILAKRGGNAQALIRENDTIERGIIGGGGGHFCISKIKNLVRFSLTPLHFYMCKTKSLIRFSLTPSHLGKWCGYHKYLTGERDRPSFASLSRLHSFI